MQQEKKRYFRKPDTMEEILEGKEIVRAEKGLVAQIMQLTDTQALVVPEFIPDRFENRQRYLKRAESITLQRMTVADIRRNKIKPYEALEEAVERFKLGFGAGYTYRSVKDGTHSRVLFDDCVAGDLLYTYVTQSRLSWFDIKPYNDVEEARIKGGKYKVAVPSRTKRMRRYSFTMEFVPFKDCVNNDLLWTHTHSDHLCLAKQNDFSFRYSRVHQWDPHTIAAYYGIAAAAASEGDMSAATHTALVRPTQNTVDFYRKITRQTAVEVRDLSGHHHKRPANKAEREALLVAYVKRNGLRDTFVRPTELEKFVEYK